MNPIEKFSRGVIDRLSLAFLRTSIGNRSARFLTYQRKRLIRRNVEQRLRETDSYPDRVLRGPFEGLNYPPQDYWVSCRFEKLIGAYEFEIHPFVSRLLAHRDYRTIVHIGTAEGFFAVGFAWKFPKATVIAYERDAVKVKIMRELASLNQVLDRITILGNCSPEDLRELNDRSPELVFCDTEGAEKYLLDSEVVPWLKSSDILVETHDCFVPGISEELRRRFKDTHIIESITSSGLKYDQFPELQELSFEEIYAMVCEDRPSLQEWLLMTPKTRPLAPAEKSC